MVGRQCLLCTHFQMLVMLAMKILMVKCQLLLVELVTCEGHFWVFAFQTSLVVLFVTMCQVEITKRVRQKQKDKDKNNAKYKDKKTNTKTKRQ